MGDFLVGIVDDDGKLIRPKTVSTFDHDVTHFRTRRLHMMTLKLVVELDDDVRNF